MPQPGTNFPAIPRNQKVVFVVDHTLESRNLLDTSPSGEDILTSYKAAITGTLDEVLARGSEIALISYWGGIDTEIGFTQSKTAFLSELNSIAPQGAVGVWYATLGGAMTHVAAFLDASSVTEDDDVTIVWFSCGAETHITQFADAFDSAKATWPFLKVMWLRTITAGYGGIYDQVRHRVTIPTFTTDYDETLAWALDATLPPSSADYGAEDPDTVPVGKSYVDATGVLGPLTPPEAFIKTSVPGTGLTGIVVPVSNVATDEPDPSPEELIIWQATRFECRITDFSGAYSYGVPTGHVISADWQTERYGGYANFNLTVAEHGVGDDVDLSNLPAFARVEFWIDGVCRYRGFVTKPVVSLANPRQYQLSGFGLFVIAGDSTVRRNFVYGQFKDIAKIFSDLAHDALENRHEGLQIESHTIGMTRQTANYRGKSLKDAVDAMVTESGNAAAWGFYVKEVDYTEISRPGVERSYALFYRPNSLEFYPITSLDSPDHSLIVPSSVANGAQGEQDWTRVINLVTLNGGTRTNPNLVYNANFSKLVNAGAGVLNLIPNADFEDGGTGWGGGGSLKEAGGQEGNPFSGSKMWEIDRENEALERTLTGLTLTTDEQYRFAFRYRNENQSAYRNLEITLNWHYDNGSESSGVVDQFLTADKGYWVLWEVPLTVPTPPVGRTITGIHFKIRMHSVASNGTGVLLDAIEFHSMTALAQDGWEAIQNGTSRIKSQQWDYRDSPGIDDSGYCLAITVTSSDNNANCVAVRMRNAARYNVRSGELLGIMFHMKKPDWYSGTSPKMVLRHTFWKADGSERAHTDYTIATGALDSSGAAITAGLVDAGGGWYSYYHQLASYQDAVQGSFELLIRGDGSVLLDCFAVRNAEERAWCPDGNYQIRVRADDSRIDYDAIGITGAREALILGSHLPENYNVREKTIDVASITNDADALAYLARYFAQNALPADNPRITITNADEAFRPGQAVYVGGDFGAELLSRFHTIARVSERWGKDGNLATELDLSREWRDEASYFIELIDRRTRRQSYDGASSAGAGAASPGSGGGGASWVSGPSYWGTSGKSSSDATLHDDFRAGPHISDEERDTWDDTTDEVVDARDTYDSLDERLDAISAGSSLTIGDVIEAILLDLTDPDNPEFIIEDGELLYEV